MAGYSLSGPTYYGGVELSSDICDWDPDHQTLNVRWSAFCKRTIPEMRLPETIIIKSEKTGKRRSFYYHSVDNYKNAGCYRTNLGDFPDPILYLEVYL